MADERLHLVYATDKGFLMPTKVSAASAIAHASEPGRLVIDILDCGFDDEEWQDIVGTLRKIGPTEIYRHVVDMTRFSELSSYRGNLGNYARFLIPEVLPSEGWCVYADGDTLFLDDVLSLICLCRGDVAIIGHRDICDDLGRQELFSSLGFKGNVANDCVCSGFLLMNLDWFRVHAMTGRLIAFLKDVDNANLYDQDALNILCEGCVRFLPWEWGVFNIESFEGGRIPKCVHYAFGKPWSFGVKWTRCLLDVDRLWFRAARKYCGIGFREAGTTPWQYCKRAMRSVCHRMFLRIVCLTARGRARWEKQWRYYSPVSIRKLVP